MITVLCGIIENEKGDIFLARRKKGESLAGKWEFPGGKLEKGETEKECLQRELLEELGMKVKVMNIIGENPHQYPNISIKLIAYKCEFISASYELIDHDIYMWVEKEELKQFDLAPADIPLLELL